MNRKSNISFINNSIVFVTVLFISIVFFSDFIFFDKLPATSGDPAIKYWHYLDSAKEIQSNRLSIWEDKASVGRSVFANDIFKTPFSGTALFISLFDNQKTGYVMFFWLELILFGLFLLYYLLKWYEINFHVALAVFGVFVFTPGWTNEYFFDSFGGYFLLPLMLDIIHRFKDRPSYKYAIYIGILLALVHWISNIATAQFSGIFLAIYSCFLIYKTEKKHILKLVLTLILAVLVWIGLMAFYIFPFYIEVINSGRSHIYSLTGGLEFKSILLYLTVPFTSWLFIDEKMITTGLLTQYESLNVYLNILLLPALIVFIFNIDKFKPQERIFFYYVAGFLFLGWLNNYIPILGYFTRIFKATGWWRSLPIYFLCGSIAVGLVISKLIAKELVLSHKNNRILLPLLNVGMLFYILLFIGMLIAYITYYINSDILLNAISKFSVRPASHLGEYLSEYYFKMPVVGYWFVILFSLLFSIILFKKLIIGNSNKATYIGLLFFIVISQACLSKVFYPFNNGVNLVENAPEVEFLRRLNNNDRVGIVFNQLNEVENIVRKNINYKDKDANLGLSVATQSYPEVTRFQSNIIMDGSLISSLGPAAYTLGSNFTSERLIEFHSNIIEQDEFIRNIFEKKKSYLRLGKNSLNSPLINIAGINYILSSLPVNKSNLDLAFKGKYFYVYKNNAAYPRYYMADNAIKQNDQNVVLTKLNNAETDDVTYVESDAFENYNTNIVSNITVNRIKGDEIKLIVKNEQPGLFVLNEAYHPGWKVFVNGNESKLNRVNYLFTGVSLPAGENRLYFKFSSKTYVFGWYLTLFVMCGIFLYFAYELKAKLMLVKKQRE